MKKKNVRARILKLLTSATNPITSAGVALSLNITAKNAYNALWKLCSEGKVKKEKGAFGHYRYTIVLPNTEKVDVTPKGSTDPSPENVRLTRLLEEMTRARDLAEGRAKVSAANLADRTHERDALAWFLVERHFLVPGLKSPKA